MKYFTTIIFIFSLICGVIECHRSFAQDTDSITAPPAIVESVEPVKSAETILPVIEEKPDDSSDRKKLKLLQKIGVIEGKIDKKKSKLDKILASWEKKIMKLQSKVSKYENKLSLTSKESKQKKITISIEKAQKIILKHETQVGKIQAKFRKKIEKMEEKISALGPN